MLSSVAILFLLSPLICTASHFEGGTITYKVINSTGSDVFIIIIQTYIYVYPGIYCDDTYIANQSPQLNLAGKSENGKYLNCTSNCTTSGGYVPVPLNTYCTDYSSTMDITIGERSDVVNVSSGSYFVVTFTSQYWRPLTLPPYNSSGKTWNLSCVIDLRLREDGTFNHPPVATMISPIYIPVGTQQSIFIPTIDADNDQVRCRFANGSNECADVCPPASLPNGTTLLSNCTLLITGVNVSDWYSIATMIEDFVNSSSTTPLSAVPVQFLINVQSNSSCSPRPLLTGPVSQTGECVGVQVGQSYSIQLVAENFCSNTTTINDIATLSFPIVIKTPIVQNTTTLWSVSLTWIPTASQIGSQVLCAVAIDSANVQSNQYCITFTVAQGGVPACPGQPVATTQYITTVGSTSTNHLSLNSATLDLWSEDQSSTDTMELSTVDYSDAQQNMVTSMISPQQATDSTPSSFLSPLGTSSRTDSMTPSTTSLQESSYLDQSTDSTSSTTASPSSSVSTSYWSWLAAVASLLIAICICCCYCYSPRCLCCCCPLKRHRKRSSLDESPREDGLRHSPVPPYMAFETTDQDSNVDIASNTRPSSIASSRHADDIQLTVLPSPRKKPMPHYAKPLQRSPRVAPMPTSLSSASVRPGASSSSSTTPEAYLFGDRYASKTNNK